MSDHSEASIDSAYCEALVRATLDGDHGAHARLMAYLWPHWLRLARRSRSLGRLAASADHVHTVAVRVAEKLSREDHHHLALYATWKTAHPGKDFGDWIRIVLRNVARDVAREELGPRRGDGALPSVKRLLNELGEHAELDDLSTRPPYTDGQTARELMEFARTHLAADQLAALMGWVQGLSFDELGAEQGVDAPTARKRVRAAVARLRRAFA